MTSDIMTACADLTLADAISDYSVSSGMTEGEVRTAIIVSGAYDALYDFETGLWCEGPDYFVDFFLKMSRVKMSRAQADAGDLA